MTRCILLVLALFVATADAGSEVRVIGEMRRVFMAHDIGPNVELSKLKRNPHLYALGPVAGLKAGLL